MKAPTIGARGLCVANRILRHFGLVLRPRAAALEAESILAELTSRQLRATQEARTEAWRMRRQLLALDAILSGAGNSALSGAARRLVRIGLGIEEERKA